MIAFDLDGTLVDSVPDLHAAAAKLLLARGRDPLPPETVRSFIGNGVPKLVERVAVASGLDLGDLDLMIEEFRVNYAAEPTERSTLYPGVADALAVLAASGRRMSVCTNKPESPARVVLEGLGIAHHFSPVIGGDTLSSIKPDPAMLLRALDEEPTKSALFVGDSEVDAATARNAGVRFLLYTEGYRKSPVSEIPHDAAFSHWDDLPALVASMTDKAA